MTTLCQIRPEHVLDTHWFFFKIYVFSDYYYFSFFPRTVCRGNSLPANPVWYPSTGAPKSVNLNCLTGLSSYAVGYLVCPGTLRQGSLVGDWKCIDQNYSFFCLSIDYTFDFPFIFSLSYAANASRFSGQVWNVDVEACWIFLFVVCWQCFQNYRFTKNSFTNTISMIRVANGLDPDERSGMTLCRSWSGFTLFACVKKEVIFLQRLPHRLFTLWKKYFTMKRNYAFHEISTARDWLRLCSFLSLFYDFLFRKQIKANINSSYDIFSNYTLAFKTARHIKIMLKQFG